MTSLIAATADASVAFVAVVVRAAGVGATRPRAPETKLARSRRPLNAANANASTPIARRRLALTPPGFFGGGGGVGAMSGAVVAGSVSYMRIASRAELRAP